MPVVTLRSYANRQKNQEIENCWTEKEVRDEALVRARWLGDRVDQLLEERVMDKEDLPEDIQTFSLFANSNRAPAVFKGIRKKDNERFAVFDMIGPDNTMKDKLFSLEDFAFYKKSDVIHAIGDSLKKAEAYNYLRDLIENQ